MSSTDGGLSSSSTGSIVIVFEFKIATTGRGICREAATRRGALFSGLRSRAPIDKKFRGEEEPATGNQP